MESICGRAWPGAGLFVVAVVGAPATAQCARAWTAGLDVPGVSLDVHALTAWDPDGPGPAPSQWIIGGAFALAGGTPARGIASFDPASATWSALGTGLASAMLPVSVLALQTRRSGELVVGGMFDSAGGASANAIAQWNGNTWTTFGSGFDGPVHAILERANGELVAAGQFLTAGGVPSQGIARWNGTAWAPLGNGTLSVGGSVFALASLGNGDLVVGGTFSAIGGVPANGLARWNGVAWSAIAGTPAGGIAALALLPNGELVAGGANSLARWNGTSWTTITGASGITAIAATGAGDFVVGGSFTAIGGINANSIAHCQGGSWTALGNGVATTVNYPPVRAIAALPGGDLLVGGHLTTAGFRPANFLARWDGAAWNAVGPGTDGSVNQLRALANGDLVAVGAFGHLDTTAAHGIARWNGQSWTPLGSGLGSASAWAVGFAVAEAANGDLVVGGDFTHAGSSLANHVARWNGQAWSPLGSGVSGATYQQPFVQCVATRPNGDLVIGGNFLVAGGVTCNGIARWNGSTWSAMGSGITGSFAAVMALVNLPNGDLVASGQFATMDGIVCNGIARWNGSSWSSMGSGVGAFDNVSALAVGDNGDLYAAGSFFTMNGVPANCIARWNGASWSAMGSGIGGASTCLLPLPNAHLLAAPGTANGGDLRRWDGATWSTVEHAGVQFERIQAMALRPDGTLAVGGTFRTVGANWQPGAYFAWLAPTCPASALATGSGCSGSPNLLHARSLPWLGTTCRAHADGMPANGVAVRVLGFAATSVPLASLLPTGGAGCTLLVTPDGLDGHVPVAGGLDVAFAIPPTVALAGQIVREQVVPFELAAIGIVAVTATNALELTLGSL